MAVNLKELYDACRNRLNRRWDEREAQHISRQLIEECLDAGFESVIAGKSIEADPAAMRQLHVAMRRLEWGEPVQYVLGRAFFMGLKLKCDRRALIPRPETEELCRLIIRENNRPGLRVLDIGTGSGCIALALAHHLAASEVWALDADSEAIELAAENARMLNMDLHLLKSDLMTQSFASGTFDIIASNPPYVPESEKVGMDAHVLNFEPHRALFVPDSEPIVFYRRIALLAREKLSPGGGLYFEIHDRMGKSIVEMLHRIGFVAVQLHPDIHGKQRIVSCRF